MPNTDQTINYQYRRPENFDENDAQFKIFEKIADDKIENMQITKLRNVRISTNSVVFKYFKVFRETCINEENFRKYSKGWKFFLKFIFPHFNFSKKTFLLITDEWTSNYYHWHVFALTKLLAMKEQNLLSDSLIFLPKKYKKYQFVLPSLEAFGVKKNQLVFLRRKSNIKVSEVCIAKGSQQNPRAFSVIRASITSHVKTTSDFGEKVYISRNLQQLRFIENEEEVMVILEKYGFKKIYAETLSYQEQVAIFNKAKYVVAPHGAGLTNIFFMNSGTSVLEMATKADPTKPVTDYFKLANLLDLKYFYQECGVSERSRKKDFHHAALVVDLVQLENNLKLMLKNE